MEQPKEPDLSAEDARTLRFLRGLVLVLTATMILGIGTLVVLFATRFPGGERIVPAAAEGLRLPERIALPDGARPLAVTQGDGWWAVVTDADEILIYDAATGAVRQRVAVK
ncbi:DUF6476 family protein [Tropicimonas aquimaris]|uniref:DUF6476 family protein n=1 Tax=Tropicimonas aquimaris TaxID=914152 RepID=A0ABW3INH5_9RHOB